jgi:serum/glucocorticoid-regulated kinase 2
MIAGKPPFYSKNWRELFSLITDKPLVMWKEFSAEASDLIERLLEWDPKKWLGSGSNGAENIKKHPFFDSIDWAKLNKWELPAPFVPRVAS